MNRKERLMATLRGESVDRPAVNFYELNGYDENPHDTDPFNIYSDPSWRPLIELTKEKTDRIVMRNAALMTSAAEESEHITRNVYYEQCCKFIETKVNIAGRELTELKKIKPDIRTTWTTEHLLKDIDDLQAYLELPQPTLDETVDTDIVLQVEDDLADTGIVMIDTPDALCMAATLFDMETFTVVALTEQDLFHRLLQKFADWLLHRTEAIARALPGRLWRIYGPEYASPPYLPPHLFEAYVVNYDKPLVDAIQRRGGFARIHSHGNLRAILDHIVSIGCRGLDPIEPPPQGDVELAYVKKHYGQEMVLFGNLELSDIVTLPTIAFEPRIRTALEQGASGQGRGFVLMPSAAPYGRKLPTQALKNYEKIIEIIEGG